MICQWSGVSKIRAAQLYSIGHGVRRIRNIMLAEGWSEAHLPPEGTMNKVLLRDCWRPRAHSNDLPVPPPSVRPADAIPYVPIYLKAKVYPCEVQWEASMKRCPVCYGMATGEHCPQGHAFPKGVYGTTR